MLAQSQRPGVLVPELRALADLDELARGSSRSAMPE
jgi:hypothetical protein